ncbi:cation:proton antiporter [Leptothoe sp. PORK10 BA2]|uniref:cation:proton antiporter n=1 Tax=Leptothoe sp. PORK10 BA2 TaxID=3110254 RepID=UPI002B200C97|nr:cation:proton antiporter [Leptothoe sp. PORK10 BA2]MEA5462622.1 cation:proton antiporter [Leptothoe sp. PORK10 BA2]
MESFSNWLIENPIVSFTILLLASLIVPPLAERLRLPGLVGLLLAGTLLGPSGLQLLKPDTETVKLLSDIGKVYLMFVAGLEIDMTAFRRTRNRSLTFGMTTFAVPLITGTILGLQFDMGWNSSILIGSLLASHTLLAYPLIQRLGVVRNEGVTVTVGATIFTDIGALLVLAICISIHQGEFTWFSLPLQLLALAIYSTLVLWGLDRLGKEYFRRTGNDEGNQFLFILLALFVSSVGAQVIHIENIVGAFLAGLAVNDVLGRGAVKEKVEFVGGVLFIPFFFIGMGLLIDIPTFFQTLVQSPLLVMAIVSGLILSKFIAAWCVKLIYHYSWPETLTMWSLSLPQVAATLAAALVGYQAGLLSEAVFNSVIVLMLVTSTLGPVITRHYASQLSTPDDDLPLSASEPLLQSHQEALEETISSGLNILLPIRNPVTEPDLVDIASRLAQQYQGQLLPLAIAQPSHSLNDPEFNTTLEQARQRLTKAVEMGREWKVPIRPILRIDRDIAMGICHASQEQNTQMILMGYGDMVTFQARLLGSVVDQVLRNSPCAVSVMQLRSAPKDIQRVIVPLWIIQPDIHYQLEFAQYLAAAIQGAVTVLYFCPVSASETEQDHYRQQISQRLEPSPHLSHGPLPDLKIKVLPYKDVSAIVLRMTHPTDIIVLDGKALIPGRDLPLDHWGTTILKNAQCSVALFLSKRLFPLEISA